MIKEGPSGLDLAFIVSQLIEQEVSDATDWSFASALSGLLLVVTIVLYVVYDRLVPIDEVEEIAR